MPEFDREGGSGRILHLIESLQDAGWSVTFLAENMTGGERYARLLRQRGIMVYGGIHSRGISADVYLPNPQTLLEVAGFDLVIVAFWYFAEALMPLVRAHAPQARLIVDSIDLHFLRQSRKTFFRKDNRQPPGALDQQYASEMIRELNAYAAADGVFTVSQKEADLINDFLATPAQAYAVPDREDLPASPIPFAERSGILFVGNFRHYPNVQAVEYLFEQILPRLDQRLLQRHPLYIVGNGLDGAIAALGHGLAHVKMVGWVPSLMPYYNRAAISIVPLLHGAGTKRKVIETLSVGTPCVSTSIGAEGLDLQHGDHVWIADDPEAFAAGVVQVLNDETLWGRLAQGGRAHIRATHGQEAIGRRLDTAIESVLERTPRQAASSKSLPWLSYEMTTRLKQVKVGLKHLLRKVDIRAQLE